MEQSVVSSCHKHRRTTLERVEKYISHEQFKDVNLRGRLYPAAKEVDKLLHWVVPGGAGAWEDWPFSRVVIQDFQPVAVGQAFGPLWSTHWFRVEVTIPVSWSGQEVWLHWVSQAEALLWSDQGDPLQGFSPGGVHLSPLKGAKKTGDLDSGQSRTDYLVSKQWCGSEDSLVFYIELACCGMFGAGADGMISPPDEKRTFTLEAVEVSTRDAQVFKLLTDLEVLYDMVTSLPETDPRGYQALYTANHIINIMLKGDCSMACEAANSFFAKKNGQLAHTLALIGNCHIDTAWLWPYSETKRKCARSWSSTLVLMEEYPEMTFACSQAQQLSWVKTHYPSLFKKIHSQVMTGRFIPVGGTWVEMDGLIPSGESFMRQFLYGQLFFKKEFGITCEEFWLPDTFGYSAQFPQICKNFGISRFLTQKLSWSLVNKFPHHNFLWEGLDGSTVLAHFPPGDSYELKVKVKEAVHTVTNLQDKGRVSSSVFLYGHGDGGGGPTRTMLERSRRLKDVDGCPRMQHMSPGAFFQRLETEKHNLCRWVGELYLELHNGTYTSQAAVKCYNRKCESALRDAELLLAVTTLLGLMKKNETLIQQGWLVEAWKKVLLNQFHDVIPGTSIGIVYRDAMRLYNEALSCATEVKKTCCSLLFEGNGGNPGLVAINTLPWEVKQVVVIKDDDLSKFGETVQSSRSSQGYMVVQTSGIGWTRQSTMLSPPPVTVVLNKNNTYTLKNQYIRAEINKFGQVESLKMNGDTHDVFCCNKLTTGLTEGQGNQLMMFDDVPLYWDAWDVMDYHLETGTLLNKPENVHQEVEVVEDGPIVVKLRWILKLSQNSTLYQEIELSAVSPYLVFRCEVDWHENRKFLKVAFNTSLLARTASFDSQFGYIERPTHSNTSWDSAKFEVCGHKWADLSEHSLGLAVLNDSKYGWTARGSTLMLSLLRAPKAPDADCDMGSHTFSYALMPHKGQSDRTRVQQCAYEFNNSLMICPISTGGDGTVWFSVEGNGVMIEAVKLAEDGSGDIVVRLCEILGTTTSVKLQVPNHHTLKKACLCSGLEEPLSGSILTIDGKKNNGDKYTWPDILHFTLTPFKILNVRLTYT